MLYLAALARMRRCGCFRSCSRIPSVADAADPEASSKPLRCKLAHLQLVALRALRLTAGSRTQVHPVVNLVRDFDPQDNFPLGHLALFNVRCALAAARHCELSPPAPGSVPTGAGMEWDTLSFPSRITSEDGMSGRSHPVGSVAAGFPAAEALNSNAKSVAGSQATDIDAELMREGSELNA